jgi:hypothetical protein
VLNVTLLITLILLSITRLMDWNLVLASSDSAGLLLQTLVVNVVMLLRTQFANLLVAQVISGLAQLVLVIVLLSKIMILITLLLIRELVDV